jgi:DNA-binding protein
MVVLWISRWEHNDGHDLVAIGRGGALAARAACRSNCVRNMLKHVIELHTTKTTTEGIETADKLPTGSIGIVCGAQQKICLSGI